MSKTEEDATSQDYVKMKNRDDKVCLGTDQGNMSKTFREFPFCEVS